MKIVPFEIPESLKSYLVTFESDPEKGISTLEKYITKRRHDPVGFMLLALLLKHQGKTIEAKSAAVQAKSLAPGSTLLDNLHYFLSHPDGFNAWVPDESNRIASVHGSRSSRTDISMDLDVLISRLTRANSKRIKIASRSGDNDNTEDTSVVDTLATPTLAHIYEQQGKYAEAVKVYQKLKLIRPEKADVFQKEIDRLQELV